MSISIEPSHKAGALADIIFQNELTSSWGEAPFYCPVRINGVMIRARIDAGDGQIPDTITVEVEPGWEAVPSPVVVNEGKNTTIVVFPQLLG